MALSLAKLSSNFCVDADERLQRPAVVGRVVRGDLGGAQEAGHLRVAATASACRSPARCRRTATCRVPRPAPPPPASRRRPRTTRTGTTVHGCPLVANSDPTESRHRPAWAGIACPSVRADAGVATASPPVKSVQSAAPGFLYRRIWVNSPVPAAELHRRPHRLAALGQVHDGSSPTLPDGRRRHRPRRRELGRELGVGVHARPEAAVRRSAGRSRCGGSATRAPATTTSGSPCPSSPGRAGPGSATRTAVPSGDQSGVGLRHPHHHPDRVDPGHREHAVLARWRGRKSPVLTARRVTTPSNGARDPRVPEQRRRPAGRRPSPPPAGPRRRHVGRRLVPVGLGLAHRRLGRYHLRGRLLPAASAARNWFSRLVPRLGVDHPAAGPASAIRSPPSASGRAAPGPRPSPAFASATPASAAATPAVGRGQRLLRLLDLGLGLPDEGVLLLPLLVQLRDRPARPAPARPSPGCRCRSAGRAPGGSALSGSSAIGLDEPGELGEQRVSSNAWTAPGCSTDPLHRPLLGLDHA